MAEIQKTFLEDIRACTPHGCDINGKRNENLGSYQQINVGDVLCNIECGNHRKQGDSGKREYIFKCA